MATLGSITVLLQQKGFTVS